MDIFKEQLSYRLQNALRAKAFASYICRNVNQKNSHIRTYISNIIQSVEMLIRKIHTRAHMYLKTD